MRHSLLFLFCVLAVNLSGAESLPEFPFIHVEGVAETEVPPDLADLQIRIRVTDADAAKALESVAERSGQVLELLDDNGVSRDDITAYETKKEPMREKDSGRTGKIVGYEITRWIKFTLRELEKFPSIMYELLAMSDVFDVRTDFDTTNREKILSKLTKQACQDARNEAEDLASGVGGELGPVFAVSEFDEAINDVWRVMSQSRDGHEAYFAPSSRKVFIVPSTISMKRSVNVIFQLKPR